MNYYQKSIKILIIISIFLLAIGFFANTINASSIGNGTSGGIKEGINNAINGETITLATGQYSGVNNTGITINKNLTIVGKGAPSSVIIDGQKKARIFAIANNVDITFINITFANGKDSERGGAVYNNYTNSKITFINCTFVNNTASIQGGAIFNSRGSCTVKNSVFNNNIVGHSAGAIYNGYGGNCTIINSIFTNNYAIWGATIFNGNNGYLTVSNSTFTNNKVNKTGIIYNNANCKAILNNNVIKSNTGSGIYNEGNLTTNDNSFSSNTNGNIVGNGIVKSETKNNLTKISLKINNFKALFKKSNLIKATIHDQNGNVLSGKQVSFFVNGKIISKSKTNSNGVASFKYIFQSRKIHKITVKFLGDNNYLATNSKTLSVTPKDITYLTLAKCTVNQDKKVILKATLKNNLKKVMKGSFISFYANNTYLGKSKTNAKGEVTLVTKVSFNGPINFIAKYTGTKTYHSSSSSRNETIS